MEIIKLDNSNFEELKELYNSFSKIAEKDFLFELPPLNFDDLKYNFQQSFVKIYLCKNPSPEAFMIFSDNLTQGIEITLIYTKNTNNKSCISQILEKFIADAKLLYKNKTISYPMLGVQNLYIEEIQKAGFDIVNEKILELQFEDFTYPNNEPLLYNYTFAPWNDSYSDNAITTIANEFSNSNDAKFDPRFNGKNGVKDILQCITQGIYGEFLPYCTTILKYKNMPVGYCFVNLTTDKVANIPLLVIAKEHQGKHFATKMINNSINSLKNAFLNNKIKANLINTTCDASNHSALKSYLKSGFVEKTNYFHAYMNLK